MKSVALHAGKNAGTGTARYYSFNQGLTHFIVFTAEAYAYKSGAQFLANQLAFMKSDLAAVNRSATPWVVGLVHKTWWMQMDAYADFTPVLQAGKVDIVFTGHYHYYSRFVLSLLLSSPSPPSLPAPPLPNTPKKYPRVRENARCLSRALTHLPNRHATGTSPTTTSPARWTTRALARTGARTLRPASSLTSSAARAATRSRTARTISPFHPSRARKTTA